MTAILAPSPIRSRWAVGIGLVAVTIACWAYLVLLAARMGSMSSPLAMPMTAAWTGADVVLMWTMWAMMMAGMMLPSAAPMITAYARTLSAGRAGIHGSTPVFAGAYLAVWGVFGALATGAQWVLHDAALVNAMGTSQSRWLGGLILVGAGAYQFTGLKDACLRQCRTPLGFLLSEWRPGTRGAFIMGIRHGFACTGCCWALMAMLFVLGVMNLWWIALVAAVVFLEKVVRSDALTRALGWFLAIWGAALIIGVNS